ncbi:MAG TPA: HD domain-containing protein [Solirubrobacteraceae bacterium]|nr:HD domain-containing protein [Solirubrobacteraceae bacterium]
MAGKPQHLPELNFQRQLPLAQQAVELAVELHAGQLRGSDGASFVMHPMEVASLLEQSDYPDHVVAAAVLHDVLENTDEELDDLEARFGPDVAGLVAMVTDDPAIDDVEARKHDVRERVRTAGGEAAAVYAADKVSKVREIRTEFDAGTPWEELETKLERHRVSLAMLERTIPGSHLVELLRSEIDALDELQPER